MPKPFDVPALHTADRQWKLVERRGTGLCIVVEHENIGPYPVVAVLGRVDLAAGILYLWDQRVRREVCVKVADLFPSKMGVE